ncbi:MAG: SPOR domain-containing protein [Deltaproteobacteria bacterium]|jgi:cell division septation protein DedD|nr:SPOR domain-containing protein [Deltaproteobacteria bacterium]MBT4527201.1 SPOR domain-containing protein [Deltaproteobacteria bacterium]
MKQIGNRRRPSKNATQFSIDLDIRGMIILLVLATFTAATVFYLGVIFGKASRNPNQDFRSSKTANPIKVEEKALTIPKDLKIYDINDEPNTNDNFTSNIKKELKKTDDIIKSTEKQIKLDNKKNQTDTKSSTTKTQAKTWPDQKTVTVKPANNYTIQVFVTKSKEKANKITKQLRQKAFDAYIEEVSHQGNKLFKIRVGHKTKQEIPQLKAKLGKVVGGMGMGLSVIKID